MIKDPKITHLIARTVPFANQDSYYYFRPQAEPRLSFLHLILPRELFMMRASSNGLMRNDFRILAKTVIAAISFFFEQFYSVRGVSRSGEGTDWF